MKTHKKFDVWQFVLSFVMLCMTGMPMVAAAGTALPIPTGPLNANGHPATPDYYTTANWAFSPPLAKFVDTLPGLTSGNKNSTGQYLSVGKPDITTYPGSDYYEINLIEYRQQMHPDLPATTGPTTGSTVGTLLRGYVQVNNGTATSTCGGNAQPACTNADNTLTPDPVHFLGPIIVAQRDRPVRIKFTNKLPIGQAGDLFIPTDTSVMGAGVGPAYADGSPCNSTIEPNGCASYTQNRSAIHLHGGKTPWISDGTPHQWIVPAGEITPFTKGVSLQNVPDMPDPGDGSTTYYYTNQQSARLMFYHEHAWGITRLNPYVGVAAGYLITDQWEQDLITRKILPPFLDQIPLVIMDRTFVDATPTTKYVYNPATGLFDTPITVPKVRETDPLWNWGSSPLTNGVREPVTGDLWMPHVYMPAQTQVAGSGGANPFGRWMYGPWFYPATIISKGPIDNPYYDQDCSSPFPDVYANCTTPGQPTKIPGTPTVSMGMEAFQDSAVVNGAAFPSLNVEPRAYRFRILNAASDRFWNLSLYKADSTPGNISPDSRLLAPGRSNRTEVKMVPASATLAAQNNWPPLWPIDGRDGGVPDPGTCTNNGGTYNCTNFGPSFLQIGTESGFLPSPVVINPQPITYNVDPTAFWVGNVNKMALALGPAERADVIVDFSQYAGQTLILYNDAPAAWPAGVANYDYYTGAPDMRDTGGYGTGGTFNPITGFYDGGTGPRPGYAPNTRTVMQIVVGTTGNSAGYTYNKAAIEREFTSSAPVTDINPATVQPNRNPPYANVTRTKTLFERSQEPIVVGQAAYKSAYPSSYFPINFPWEGINQINDHFLQFVTLAGDPVKVPTEPKGLHDEMGASFDPVYGRMSGNLGMQLPNPTSLTAMLVLYGYSDIPSEFVNASNSVNVEVLKTGSYPYSVADGTQIWKISHNGVDTHPIHFHIFDVQLINRVGWDGQILMPEPNELGWKETIKISPLEDTIVAVRPRAPELPFGIPTSIRPLNPGIPIDSVMGFTANSQTTGSNWPIPMINNTIGSGFNSVDWVTGGPYVFTPATQTTPARPYDNFKGVVTNVLYNFGWEYVWHCHILSHEEMDMMRPIVLNVVTSAPAAPTLQVTAGGLLTWTDATPAATSLGNPANEIGFRIERAEGNGPFDTNFAKALANATSFLDTTAQPNSIYSYRVVAYNATGESVSNTVQIQLIVVPATPLQISPINIGGNTDPFIFTAVTGASGYQIWHVDPTGTGVATAVLTPVQAGCPNNTGNCSVNLGVMAGGIHYWQVAATSSTVYSPWSPSISFTVAPNTPVQISPTLSGISSDPFIFTAVSGASGYQIWHVDPTGTGAATSIITPAQAGCPNNTGNCSINIGTLDTGTHYWQVVANNAAGNSPWSPSINFTVGASIPMTPLQISPITTSSSLDPFIFSAVSGATGYQIWHVDPTGTGTATTIFTPTQAGCPNNTGNCSINIGTLDTGTHYWQVVANNAAGSSPWSPAISFIVPASVPATPVQISPTVTGISSDPFVFSAVPGATGYRIWHVDPSGTGAASAVLTPTQAGCPNNSGNCNVSMGTLSTGTHYWQVVAINGVGSGSWSPSLAFSIP